MRTILETKYMKNNPVVKNASWIIGCRIVQALLNFIISMLTARYLGPSNYGSINYAAAIVAFVVPIMQLGFRHTIVQEIVNSPKSEGEIIGTSLLLNIISSLFSMLGVFAFVMIVNKGETETLIVCMLYSINLIFQAIEMIQYWFQAKLLSKYHSIISLIAYVVVSVYRIFLLITNKSIYWFAVSNAIDYMIIGISLVILYRMLGGQKLSFSRKMSKRLFRTGKYYIVSSMMVTIFAHTDSVMIKLMINESATGYYTAAVTCAGMATFVFAAIIDSARPSILESKKVSRKAYETNMIRLYSIITWMSLIYCAMITFFSGIIIKVLYGSAYMPSVNPLKVVVWYTTFSYFGTIRNIWILSESKQKYLWMINLSGALANVVLNYILIPIMGIMGAAIASLATQFFTNVIIGFIIRPIRDNNRLMIMGLNPKYVVRLLKNIKK